MYVQGPEYICCIPQRNQSHHMLWWTPTLADCPMIPNSPFSISICILKPELLKGYKDLHDKLRLFGMMYKEILLGIAEFQRAVLDIHAWINFIDIYQPCLFPGPNGMVKYDANQDLMGAFTEKVQVAQQLQAMGIPVWLILPSFRILPTMNVNIPSFQQHCKMIVLEHFKDHEGNLDPYPVLATVDKTSLRGKLVLGEFEMNLTCYHPAVSDNNPQLPEVSDNNPHHPQNVGLTILSLTYVVIVNSGSSAFCGLSAAVLMLIGTIHPTSHAQPNTSWWSRTFEVFLHS
ncbi:uncharacterized protein LACBIDRAFT_326611 [Laccaria bicolor S238N-H82]|uniref:Predicted protein n=1 Tax=Laccaria bicolor (strain S238N-H82 / ATCC MYA-4686) TaxID=486041 RepID=B0D976_LACBS|nr:uncharacterized protein LACBIDRAFT_326611 [Laccaria bicolor S238N-H82]EDR08962.1 predicted protein [Laccaria bicolor S238N-H82]|eukprot:XP_001880275.1 predicted protein [Laccaria bicolor S238N-H82]